MNNMKILTKLIRFQTHRFYSTSDALTRTEFMNGVRKITMCHAKTRNSLSFAMLETLLREITNDQDNVELRAIVITGDGPIFSAGHNLKELTPEVGPNKHMEVFKLCGKLMQAIINSPVPVIARVDGLAAAAGCQLVAQCDMIICSDVSSFSTPGANFGIFCSTPGVALARAVPKMAALKMLFTGNAIRADEAKRIGLVTEVCPQDKLDEELGKITNAITAKSRSVIELGKKFYYKQIQEDVATAYDLGSKVMVDNINAIDGVEGVKSFAEKRKPQWKHTQKIDY